MKKFYYSLFALLFVVGCARTISDLIIKVGDGTDADVKIEMELGKGVSNPYINYNTTNDKFEFCNEGAGCAEMGSGGGGIPLLAKGSLLTSNGTANGEFSACADGEIIEYDAAEVNGFKCVTKPASPVFTFATGNSGTTACSLSGNGALLDTLSVTATGGPIQFSFRTHASQKFISGGGDIKFASVTDVVLERNGVIVDINSMDGSNTTGHDFLPLSTQVLTDIPPAGTYTYTLRCWGNTASIFRFYQAYAIVY
jgi:hypothetical protein